MVPRPLRLRPRRPISHPHQPNHWPPSRCPTCHPSPHRCNCGIHSRYDALSTALADFQRRAHRPGAPGTAKLGNVLLAATFFDEAVLCYRHAEALEPGEPGRPSLHRSTPASGKVIVRRRHLRSNAPCRSSRITSRPWSGLATSISTWGGARRRRRCSARALARQPRICRGALRRRPGCACQAGLRRSSPGPGAGITRGPARIRDSLPAGDGVSRHRSARESRRAVAEAWHRRARVAGSVDAAGRHRPRQRRVVQSPGDAGTATPGLVRSHSAVQAWSRGGTWRCVASLLDGQRDDRFG